MVELAYTHDLQSCGALLHVGSNPTAPTNNNLTTLVVMSKVIQRNGCWYYYTRVDGQPFRRSLEVAERHVRQAAEDRPDIVVLPETSCGQEPQDLSDSAIIRAMQQHARQGRMYVAVNVIQAHGDRTSNRPS